jgi:hypothetical protein
MPAQAMRNAHDGLQGGRAAGAIAAEQAHDLARRNPKRDAVQNVAFVVVGVQAVNIE